MSKRNWTMLVLAILLVLFCFTMARAESSHKIYPEGEGLNIVNRSDKPIYVFYSIYQWGCNSSLVAGPDPDTGPFVQGVDIIDKGNGRSIYTDSYFRKLAKYRYMSLRPGERRILVNSPCVPGLGSTAKFNIRRATWEASAWPKIVEHLKKADPTWKE